MTETSTATVSPHTDETSSGTRCLTSRMRRAAVRGVAVALLAVGRLGLGTPQAACAQMSADHVGEALAALGPATLADLPLYRLLPAGLLERSLNGGTVWQVLDGLPTRVLPEDRAGEPLPVTAVAVNQSDRPQLLVAVGARLFHSTTDGDSWSEIPLDGTINRSAYVTSAAIDPSLPRRWAIGTSYDGIYLTTDAGQSWTEITAQWGIDEFYLGAGFYDEVEALEIEPGGVVIAQIGLGGGFVAIDLNNMSAVRLRPVAAGPTAYRAPAAVPLIGDLNASGGSGPQAAVDAGHRRRLAERRTGIYVAAPNASNDLLPGHFEYIRKHGFNSIVVDLKDDHGRITYDTELAMPRVAGAVEPQIDVRSLVEMAHDRNVYVIARIVLFKDRRLYSHDGNRLALWDSAHDRPWGVYRTTVDEETEEQRVIQVEHWVDPYSREVWDYNISIAAEAASLGVDEIQFDYVRFPSDGATDTVESRHAVPGADRVQALEGFLAAARSRIALPIGIDVFGFNAWSRMSYLGQDIARLARYVDVISPMFYPSHFALPFLPNLSYFDRSYAIYDDGTRRAREIAASSGNEILIRPYVQSFLIGPELEYEEPEYLRYLQVQIEGTAAAAASGYTLWNASGRYYMLP